MHDLMILVATHKKYQMPDDPVYYPIHVGKKGKKDLGYDGDDTGIEISSKNPSYCELTALYWAWKNTNPKYIGLCHYRRYFSNSTFLRSLVQKDRFELILSGENVNSLLNHNDIILPKKRNYYIESIWDHYGHTHFIEDLEKTKSILDERYPEYSLNFNKIMKRSSVHLYNMFIMKKSDFDRYCEWLFNILFELEQRIDISNYNSFQKRVFGFISELLFDVWLSREDLKPKEINVINMERINWPSKISKFFISKISGYKFSKL